MIRYLKHDEIDKSRWDACIQNSYNGLIYAYSWYLDLICENWEALVNDEYESVFPLTGKTKYGIDYLYQPFFAQQLGMFSVKRKPGENLVEEFFKKIPPHFRLVEINLNSFNNSGGSFKMQKMLNHHLDLINNYEEIYKNYSDNLKRNLKRACSNNITINQNAKPEEIINLFRENKGKDIKRFGDKEYYLLKRLIYLALHKGHAETWAAYTKENSLCAGAFFMKSNNRFIFLFSATDRLAKDTGAMSLLIDSFIMQHCKTDSILDFEGSNDKNLARFYKSFGSKEVYYPQLKINNLPWYIRWLK